MGTWNDRVFARSRAYGTAMSVLALLEDKVPFPDSFGWERTAKKFHSIRVETELMPPELKVEILSGETVKISNEIMPLESLNKWLKDNPLPRKPTVVWIETVGAIKTRTVEQVKNDLHDKLGDGYSLFIWIKEDSK